MFVNEFESTNLYRLQQIISTLKNVHNFNLDLESQSVDQIRTLSEDTEVIKNNIVQESAFNTWLQNPEYTKNMLILEAVKIYLAEIAPKRMKKKAKKVKESIEETSPSEVVDNFKLASAMMRFVKNSSLSDSTKKLVNDVAEKLKKTGTPFGPSTLTDADKKVISMVQSKMGTNYTLEELVAPNQPTQPNTPVASPSPTGGTVTPITTPPAQQKPNTVNMQKDNKIEQIPVSQVDAKRKQGYTVAPDATNEDINMIKNTTKKKINGMEEGNEFTEKLFKARRNGDPTFKVGKKTYDVTECDYGLVNEDWGSSDWTAAISYMDKYLQGQRINPDTIQDAALATAEFYHDHMGYETAEDAVPSIIRMYMIRHGWDKLLAPKESVGLNEAAHMENHDDYQASMARSELYRNAKYAMDMMKMINVNDEVKPWIAANLTKAAESLDKIYHYMDYHLKFEGGSSTSPETPVAIDEENELGETTGSTARQNLLFITEYSTKLFRMIQPGDKLEGWVAMKLTSASEAISTSKHYMDYVQFEKYASDAVQDMDEVVPMEENKKNKKKSKKAVKESRLVTIGNILMNQMIKEDQDLEQAQTLLAAKSMSDELQGIAEKIAKMSVEELMPLVDTMKEQFGQEIAVGFNDTMKASLEAVLNATTEAKDATDNAILSMQNGQVPGAADASAEAGVVPSDGDDMSSDKEDDLDSMSDAPEKSEPLGRAKKKAPKEEPKGDDDLVDLEEITLNENYTAISTLTRVIIALGLGAYGVASWMNSVQSAKDTPLGKSLFAAAQKGDDYAARELAKLDLYIEAGDWKKIEALKDSYPPVPVNESKKKMSKKDDPCWDGYEMVGTKKKKGKEVPNCVPVKESEDQMMTIKVDLTKGDQSATAKKYGVKIDPVSAPNDGKRSVSGTKATLKKYLNAIYDGGFSPKNVYPEVFKEGAEGQMMSIKVDLTKGDMSKAEKQYGVKITPPKFEEPKLGYMGKPQEQSGKYTVTGTKENLKKYLNAIYDGGFSPKNVYPQVFTESKLEEKAPPGKKAEKFIKDNKEKFKKQYGKDWEKNLYATAWDKFGPKSETYVKTTKMLESAKQAKSNLISAFESHKKKYSKMVSEGIVTDALNTGYGLEGQNILDQISETDKLIANFKKLLRDEIVNGMQDIKSQQVMAERAAKLAEAKTSAPYGITWVESGKNKSKFFETADLRKYWMELKTLKECKLIEPSDFDKRIAKLTSRKG